MQVLFEDNHLIAVNKAASEIVQGDKTGDIPLIEKVKKYLKEKYNKPGEVFLGLIHRLDRPVSGAIIFAKTSKALSRMNLSFRENKIEKIYWAIVTNPPPKTQDTLTNFLVRDKRQNKTYVYNFTYGSLENSKEAKLKYTLKSKKNGCYLLEINLLTGRHHQIRCQLAAINCPIKGDIKYGAKIPNPDASIFLHAREIKFLHPVSKEQISILAPPPQTQFWFFD